MYIQDYGNPEAFGSYGFEPEVVTANVKPTNITMEVNDNVKDVVLMVNSHEHWEMESSKITLDINLATTDYNKFDITYVSLSVTETNEHAINYFRFSIRCILS